MAKNGPLIIVEDDLEEQQTIQKALEQIRVKNQLHFFSTAEDALAYLDSTPEQPFLILTKMLLPGMNGLSFLDEIYKNDHVKKKSVPFIFFANVGYPDMVEDAYDRRVQGYFLKPDSFIALKLILMSITDYWQRAIHPIHAQIGNN